LRAVGSDCVIERGPRNAARLVQASKLEREWVQPAMQTPQCVTSGRSSRRCSPTGAPRTSTSSFSSSARCDALPPPCMALCTQLTTRTTGQGCRSHTTRGLRRPCPSWDPCQGARSEPGKWYLLPEQGPHRVRGESTAAAPCGVHLLVLFCCWSSVCGWFPFDLCRGPGGLESCRE